MSRLALLTIALLGLLPLGPAQASEGLIWKWEPGVVRRYMLRAEIKSPYVFDFNQERNVDGKISSFTLAMLVDCTLNEAVGRNASEVRCTVDKTSLAVAPVRFSAGTLSPVIDEWVKKFDAAWIDMTIGASGRIRNIDLEGVDKSNERTQQIWMLMREMTLRAFAPFDFVLPKDGVVADGAQWVQPGARAFELPGMGQGTLGGTSVTHTWLADQGGLVTWGISGAGTVAPPTAANGSLRDTFQIKLDGSGVFDTKQGAVVQAMYEAVGTPTAGSVSADAGRGLSYVQSVILQYVAPGTQDPSLGTSQELSAR